jgi:NTE family protein
MRSAVLALLAVATSACASMDPAPINAALSANPPARAEGSGVDGDALVLSFSGGGARAAAFSFGVLLGLRGMADPDGGRLIDHVVMITAVSGGSITAAYFAQHGADGLDGFRAAALDKDWADQLHTSPLAPGNWLRAYRGGLNGPSRLADWLDREVFAGGLMRDLPARPRIIINATELYTGAPFAFAPAYFDAICSDLGGVRIADAVAASMSVPLAFRPVVLETFAKDCTARLPAWVEKAARDRDANILLHQTARSFELYRDPAKMHFLHLADGGVVDNFGLSSLMVMRLAADTPYGPFSARDIVRARRLIFVVVNAEQTRSRKWALDPRGPNGPEAVEAALGDAINANKRIAYEAFSTMLEAWERDLIAYRCALSREQAAALGAGPDWRCANLHVGLDMVSFADLAPPQYERLARAPTRVSLPKDLLDDLIAAGRAVIEANGAARALTRAARE